MPCTDAQSARAVFAEVLDFSIWHQRPNSILDDLGQRIDLIMKCRRQNHTSTGAVREQQIPEMMIFQGETDVSLSQIINIGLWFFGSRHSQKRIHRIADQRDLDGQKDVIEVLEGVVERPCRVVDVPGDFRGADNPVSPLVSTICRAAVMMSWRSSSEVCSDRRPIYQFLEHNLSVQRL
jgi:hypothetical protein